MALKALRADLTTGPKARVTETSPPPDWTEDQRLAALKVYDIVETPAEAAFDDITRLIAQICDAPIAVINFLESHRQWFKSEVGLGVNETPLDVSFCAKALLQNDNLVVADATKDERFICNPLVTGDMHLRFYAGALLRTADGLPIGTLCVLDRKARPEGLTALQQTALETLARQVMTQLELRRALAQKRQSEDAARRAMAAVQSVGAWEWDIVSNRVTADAAFARLYGLDPAEAALGTPIEVFAQAFHPDDAERVSAEIDAAIATGQDFISEYRVGSCAGRGALGSGAWRGLSRRAGSAGLFSRSGHRHQRPQTGREPAGAGGGRSGRERGQVPRYRRLHAPDGVVHAPRWLPRLL